MAREQPAELYAAYRVAVTEVTLKRITSLLGRLTRQAIAHTLVLAGAAITAVGTALIYPPAGIMLGGIALVAWALLIFDVEPK